MSSFGEESNRALCGECGYWYDTLYVPRLVQLHGETD